MKRDMKLLSHGAEAIVFLYFEKKLVFKYRPEKSYRIKELDDYIISSRTKCERKVLEKLRKNNILVPRTFDVHKVLKELNTSNQPLNELNNNLSNQTVATDMSLCQQIFKKLNIKEEINGNNEKENTTKANEQFDLFSNKNTLAMDFIEGIPFKTYILQNIENNSKVTALFQQLGSIVHSIHSLHIIHGDITPMNFIYMPESQSITTLDFGLTFESVKSEDKASDLYTFEKSLKCDFMAFKEYFESFLIGYNDEVVFKTLEKVRLRGRKREESAFG